MTDLSKQWDYLIVTASNELQAQAYETQLRFAAGAWVSR